MFRTSSLRIGSKTLVAKYALLWTISLLAIGSGLVAVEAGPDPDRAVASHGLDLSLPLDCILTETCWVANYVDVAPGVQAQDFHCQPRTYDGHDGIDFAIRDLGHMSRGVSVLTAASGRVSAVRNDMEDVLIEHKSSARSIAGRECGNGVVIDHGGGWHTQYCHLQRGSVRVHPGETVTRGSELGLVGISGKTEFPHLHFTVRHNGRIVDPFTGLDSGTGCHSQGRSLWSEGQSVVYEEVALYNIGFSDGPPPVHEIRHGQNREQVLDRSVRRLILWADMFGVQEGDHITFRITGPNNQAMLDKEHIVDRTQARRFLFAGTSHASSPWPKGIYKGDVILHRTRHKEVIAKATTSVLLQ